MPFAIRRLCILRALTAVCVLLPANSQDADVALPSMNIMASAMEVIVKPATYDVAGKSITVTQSATLAVDPAEVVSVENEPLKLPATKPESWSSGARLKGPDARDVNALGAYEPGSLVIRTSPDGPALIEGKDYLVSPEFGMVGIGPESSVTPEDVVYASYRYGLLRIDSVEVDKDGVARLVRGTPHVSAPLPPALSDGATRLLNVFRGYRATELSGTDLFPILETADMAHTKSTRGRIPNTMKKFAEGKPVNIVCLGDSVTAGGNSSTREMAYPEQFRRMLQGQFPNSAITLTNVSFGGTNSSQWLRVGPLKDYFTQHPEMPADQINFDRVVALKPDLVTIEFVNDSGWGKDVFDLLYGEMRARLQTIGAEVILITPHYANFDVTRTSAVMRVPEMRPYVGFLFDFAEQHNLAVADASSRWAHLWKEGIPYVTLLDNTVNHPDDRGHTIFAEELMKCFER